MTQFDERMIEALYRILDEVESIRRNTDKPEPFRCELHGYVAAVVFINPKDGGEKLSCSECLRMAP